MCSHSPRIGRASAAESTDPARLARLAEEAHRQGQADTARWLAGLSGLHAGKQKLPVTDCPFDDPHLRAAWIWYRGVALAADTERRGHATRDLFGEMRP